MISLIALCSIVAARRVYKKAFDNLLQNLVLAGGTDREYKSAFSPVSSEKQLGQACCSLTGQACSSEKTFWQRMREAYPTRAYWVIAAVWSLFMFPFIDS
jgi:hypothetical protein